MDEKLSCCCGCIILIFIIFAGASLLSSDHQTSDDSYEVYDEDMDISESDDTDEDYDDTEDYDDYEETTDADDTYYEESSQSDDYSYSNSGGSYVGSVNSDKFHDPSCSQAQRIKDSNLITFSSREDALNSGYSPCSFCNP